MPLETAGTLGNTAGTVPDAATKAAPEVRLSETDMPAALESALPVTQAPMERLEGPSHLVQAPMSGIDAQSERVGLSSEVPIAPGAAISSQSTLVLPAATASIEQEAARALPATANGADLVQTAASGSLPPAKAHIGSIPAPQGTRGAAETHEGAPGSVVEAQPAVIAVPLTRGAAELGAVPAISAAAAEGTHGRATAGQKNAQRARILENGVQPQLMIPAVRSTYSLIWSDILFNASILMVDAA